MITKITAVIVACLLFLESNAQTNPAITKWLQNTTGIKGSHYVSGNPTAIQDNVEANVQTVQYSTNWVYVSTNGIPAYTTGPFLDGNPSLATDQNAIFKISLTPVQNTGTATATTAGNIGIFINGVALFDYRDGVSWNNSTQTVGGGPIPGPPGQGIWNRDAVVAEMGGFDCNKAHPAMGNYHHHQNPSAFSLDQIVVSNVCDLYPADGLYAIDSTQHSRLLGFAYDGFPVYGAYGYKNADGTGGIVRIKSGYQLRNITVRTHYADGTNVTDGPAVSATYPLGYFREDYEFVSHASEDYLDEHNGRFCITPEYPSGIYCYFATVDANWNSAYPYVVGPTFYGVVSASKVSSISESVTTYIPQTTVSVSGNVHTEDGSPVNTATVNATSAASPGVTGTSGDYTFNLAPSGDCTIAPFKNNDVTQVNGVSTLDIALIRRHILGAQALSGPYKIIAADADESENITTLDIALIRSFILGRTDYFPGGKLWRFIPDDFVFSNASSPFPYDTSRYYASVSQLSGEDFIAVKLGDVNESWDQNVAKSSSGESVAPSVSIDAVDAEPSSQVTVPVRAVDFNDILSMQGTVEFDTSIVRFDSLFQFGLPGMTINNFGITKTSGGIFTYSWDDSNLTGITVTDSSVLFAVRFNVIGPAGTTSPVNSTGSPLMQEVVDVNYNTVPATYVNGMVTVKSPTPIEESRETKIAVYPNPANDFIAIQVKGVAAQDLTIRMLDASGKLVGEAYIKQGSTIGYIDTRTLYNGEYFLNVPSKTGETIKKVVIMKE